MSIIRDALNRYLFIGAAGTLVLGSFGTYIPPDTGGSGGAPPPVEPTTALSLVDYRVAKAGAQVVMQATAGQDYTHAPFLVNFTGGLPLDMQTRVMRSGIVIKGWTPAAGVTDLSGGLCLAVAPEVPLGEGYVLEVRLASQIGNYATTSVGVQKWGVGFVGGFWGQSNGNSLLNCSDRNAPVPGGVPETGAAITEHGYWLSGRVPGYLFSPNGWTYPDANTNASGGRLMFLRLVCKGLEAKYGRKVPVGLVPWCWDSTPIAQFLPTAATAPFTAVHTYWDALVKGNGTMAAGTLRSSGYNQVGFASPVNFWTGDLSFVCYCQGEHNNSTARAVYLGSMNQLHGNALAYVGNFNRTAAHFGFFPAVLGPYGLVGATVGTGIENIRGAVHDFEAAAAAAGQPHARIGMSCVDLDTSKNDGLHFKDIAGGFPYATWGMKRFIQTVLHFLGVPGANYSGAGPHLASTATRDGNDIYLTVNHIRPGATLTARTPGDPLTGWVASTTSTFEALDVPVVASIHSANQIKLVRQSGATWPIYVKYMGAKPGTVASMRPDVTNPVYDDSPYPTNEHEEGQVDGFPVRATPDSITVS